MYFEDSKFELTGLQLKVVKQISRDIFLLNNYHNLLIKPYYMYEKIIIKYHDVKCSNIDEVNEFIKNKNNVNETLKIIMVQTKGKYLYKITEIIK